MTKPMKEIERIIEGGLKPKEVKKTTFQKTLE